MIAFLLLTAQLASTQSMTWDGPPVDPDLQEWYQELTDPVTGGMCCSTADCRNVRSFNLGRDTWAEVSPEIFPTALVAAWIYVPPETILRVPNPTGEAVLCYFRGRVTCFVRAPQA